MSLQLTIACGDYDRTHPLIDGSIKPEGLELNWLVLPHLEIWTRMLNYYDFDASEISLSSYLIARTIGKPLTAIPVFPARAFRHSYIFINTKSGIQEPKDLMGKRVGLAEFQQTATVWVRGTLQHEYGVKLGRYRMVHLDAALTHGDGTAESIQSDSHPSGSKARSDAVRRRA